jgi:hypothetical protein
LDLVQVGLPAQAGGRRDEPDGGTAGDHSIGQHGVDEVAVTDEVDPLDARRAVGYTGARHQCVHRPPALGDGNVDRRPVSQVDVNGRDTGQGDLGEIHDHHLGPGVLDQLGGGGPHASGSADQQDPFSVVAKCVKS